MMHQNIEPIESDIPTQSYSVLAWQEHLQNQEVGQDIRNDDILNLRIDLETTTVEGFLARI